MAISFLPTIIFPPPSSLFVTTMSILTCVSLANAGYMEAKGKHMKYSKFFNVMASKQPSSNNKQEIKLSSRNGMLLLYTPAFLVGLVAFAFFNNQDLRFVMLISTLTVHFFKRILEVLLVHKYSGFMALETAIPISLSYTLSTATLIYAQYLSQAFPEPTLDLKNVGTVLFFVGIMGNSYHHLILSNLRKEGDKEYKIPRGGLFDLVICPHYLFEIVEFMGVSCISQATFSISFTLGTIFYLTGRSYATREWYSAKFGEKL
uniref:steroid 5-alpha-reductase DET2-like isoform X2 n=1 Tax=Erigeron canadensis TaxID=72917 RepID=UPI001CB949CF|nr:steroid 5-alpha-reductase DET2-like isoform X2 [Erigeron canadensis]